MDDVVGGLLDGLFDVIYTVMELVLDSFVGRILYYAETGLCKIVGMLDQMFQIFAGISKVSYDGEKDYLVNIFFNNRSITNVYWGMALLGVAMAIGFAIAAVVRKMFDSSGRQQQSMGQILTSLLQTMFLILGMSAIMVIVLGSTNVLMQQVNYIFNDPENLDLERTIVYTDEDFAAMGRALKTIGNYSLNPSYSTRYNINSCYNDIRQDLYYLQQRKVFRYYYVTKDAEGNEVNTWQSVLQKIVNAHDPHTDLKIDVSYDAVTSAMLEAMEIIRNDPGFKPLESFSRVVPEDGLLPLDRYLFLMGTMHAAKNNQYNERAELTDPVRGPYYSGEKSIYSIKQVSSDFDIGFATDYLVVFLAGVALIFDLVIIILNCIARIFNMIFLYLIAPPIFATRPYDNGGKTKQWMTAFVVQAFSVFGTVIAMRLLLILLPIVTSSRLVLFENSMLNAMAKLVLIYGLFEVSKKATGLLTGILADSAGMQSIQAGDMSGSASKLMGSVAGAAKMVGGTALKATGKVANFATKPLQNVAKRGWDATGGRVAKAWTGLGAGYQKKDAAMEQAKQSLAVDDAKQKLLAERDAKNGGGGNPPAGGGGDLPGKQGGAGGDLPGKQNDAGGTGKGADESGPKPPDAPKPPAIPKAPSFRDSELASKAAAHKRPSVDAQGNMKNPPSNAKGDAGAAPPPNGGAAAPPQAQEQTSRRLGGGVSNGGNREVGGIGNRPTLGEKPAAPASPRSKEAPVSRNHSASSPIRSTHMSVGGDVSAKGSMSADATGSRPTLKKAPAEAAPRSKEAPAPRNRMKLDD